jgi:hypothetical protein
MRRWQKKKSAQDMPKNAHAPSFIALMGHSDHLLTRPETENWEDLILQNIYVFQPHIIYYHTSFLRAETERHSLLVV